MEVFRRPRDLTTAATFSDPPLNVMEAVKRGPAFEVGSVPIPVPPHIGHIENGAYTLAHRPHHLSLAPGANTVPLRARVTVTEITGSESFVHLRHGGDDWTMLEPGVHAPEEGAEVTVHLDPARLMVFDEAGRAVGPDAAPARAA